MFRGCACVLSGAVITSTMEVVKGTLSNGRLAKNANPTMPLIPRPPPMAVVAARRRAAGDDMCLSEVFTDERKLTLSPREAKRFGHLPRLPSTSRPPQTGGAAAVFGSSTIWRKPPSARLAMLIDPPAR